MNQRPANTEGMTCLEVSSQAPETVSAFMAFYNEVFVLSFEADECESLENFLNYIEKYSSNSLFVRILLFRNEKDIVACAVFDYFDEIKSLAFEFIVVRKEYKNQGIATKVVNFTKDLVEKKYKKSIDWMFIEMENPKCMLDKSRSCLPFWKRHNMKAVDFKYIQPALSPDKNQIETMILCVKNFSFDAAAISAEIVKKFITLYARHAMQIEKPYDCPPVGKMMKQLDGTASGTVALIDLDRYNEIQAEDLKK